MTRPICLQVYISRELSEAIRRSASAKRISMSEWVRSLLADACAGEGSAPRQSQSLERMARQSLFLMVGVDALLSGHADHQLRERAHQAYARKCKELGLVPTFVEGGEA